MYFKYIYFPLFDDKLLVILSSISAKQYTALVNEQKVSNPKGPIQITGPIPLPVGNPGVAGARGPEGITGPPVRPLFTIQTYNFFGRVCVCIHTQRTKSLINNRYQKANLPFLFSGSSREPRLAWPRRITRLSGKCTVLYIYDTI